MNHDMAATVRVQRVFGLVLLVASSLQAHRYLTASEPDIGGGRQVLAIAGIEAEFVLALLLLSGRIPRLGWKLALATFTLLAGAATWKIVRGEVDCGCFGSVQFSPGFALLVDASALAALLWFRPPANVPSDSRGALAAQRPLLVAVGLAGLSSFAVLVGFAPSKVTDEGVIEGNSDAIALDLTSLTGRRFPLLRHLEGGGRLAHGRWVVMLHRGACEACREQLPYFLQLGHEGAEQAEPWRAAMIHVPPHTEETEEVEAIAGCVHARLNDRYRWGLVTPAFLRLREGVVEGVARSVEALARVPSPGAFAASDTTPSGSPTALRVFPDYREARKNRHLSQLACGPLSLIAVLRKLGVQVTQADEDRLIARAGSTGTDFAQLQVMAKEMGVHSLGVAIPVVGRSPAGETGRPQLRW